MIRLLKNQGTDQSTPPRMADGFIFYKINYFFETTDPYGLFRQNPLTPSREESVDLDL